MPHLPAYLLDGRLVGKPGTLRCGHGTPVLSFLVFDFPFFRVFVFSIMNELFISWFSFFRFSVFELF